VFASPVDRAARWMLSLNAAEGFDQEGMLPSTRAECAARAEHHIALLSVGLTVWLIRSNVPCWAVGPFSCTCSQSQRSGAPCIKGSV
jgi:hypothetical protein